MRLILQKTEVNAKSIKTFWFQPEKPFSYVAGQFVELIVDDIAPDERGNKRWFTLSSSPTENMVSITTKFYEPHSTFKTSLLALNPGDSVTASNPMGDFVLPKDPNIPLVFVAGGIGVTPMRSMVKWLTDKNKKRDISLIYASKYSSELAFMPLFNNYGMRISEITGNNSPLTAQKIIDLSNAADKHLIYISGPEPMVESIVTQFEKTKINASQLVKDYFPGYKSI